MAPARATAPQPFDKDERVLCFHHDMLYEAKILDVQAAADGDGFQYKIHYKGWKNTWDDWVAVDRIRKFTEQNKELAAQLQSQMRNLQKSSSKLPKKGPRANGTESARGSEERTSGLFSVGRGPRRARDYDLEQVSGRCARVFLPPSSSLILLSLCFRFFRLFPPPRPKQPAPTLPSRLVLVYNIIVGRPPSLCGSVLRQTGAVPTWTSFCSDCERHSLGEICFSMDYISGALPWLRQLRYGFPNACPHHTTSTIITPQISTLTRQARA
jgi:MSL3-like protein